MRLLRHFEFENVISMLDTFSPNESLDKFHDVYFVTQFMETDLAKVIKSCDTLEESHIKYIMLQVWSLSVLYRFRFINFILDFACVKVYSFCRCYSSWSNTIEYCSELDRDWHTSVGFWPGSEDEWADDRVCHNQMVSSARSNAQLEPLHQGSWPLELWVHYDWAVYPKASISR